MDPFEQRLIQVLIDAVKKPNLLKIIHNTPITIASQSKHVDPSPHLSEENIRKVKHLADGYRLVNYFQNNDGVIALYLDATMHIAEEKDSLSIYKSNIMYYSSFIGHESSVDIRNSELPYVNYLVYRLKPSDAYVNLPNRLDQRIKTIQILNSPSGKIITLDRTMYEIYVTLSPKLIAEHKYLLPVHQVEFIVKMKEFMVDNYSTELGQRYFFRVAGYYAVTEIFIFKGLSHIIDTDKYPLTTEICTYLKGYVRSATYKPVNISTLEEDIKEIKGIMKPLEIGLQIRIDDY